MIDKMERSIFIADVRNFFDNKINSSVFEKYAKFKSKDKALKQCVDKFTSNLASYGDELYDYDFNAHIEFYGEEDNDNYENLGYYARYVNFDECFIKWSNRMLLLLESETEIIGTKLSKNLLLLPLYCVLIFGFPFLLCALGIFNTTIYWICYFTINTLILIGMFIFEKRELEVEPFSRFQELLFARRSLNIFEKIKFEDKNISGQENNKKNYLLLVFLAPLVIVGVLAFIAFLPIFLLSLSIYKKNRLKLN